jgi:hypothetical protein
VTKSPRLSFRHDAGVSPIWGSATSSRFIAPNLRGALIDLVAHAAASRRDKQMGQVARPWKFINAPPSQCDSELSDQLIVLHQCGLTIFTSLAEEGFSTRVAWDCPTNKRPCIMGKDLPAASLRLSK